MNKCDKEEQSDAEKTDAKKISLITRALSGLVYIGVVGAAIFFGTISTAIVFGILSAACSLELVRLLRREGRSPNAFVATTAAALFPLVALLNPVYLIGVALLLILSAGTLYVFNTRTRITDLSLTVFAPIYTGFMLQSMVLIRAFDPGISGGLLAIAVFSSVWVNDTFAYLIGSQFGRHKMAPRISPKKSWEGFAGGLIGSILVWWLMTFIPGLYLPIPVIVIGGIVCGFAGIIGDLVESRIKRGAGVKDSGNVMPGHGGLFDRCDSLIFVSAVAYFVLRIGGVI